jgi:NitT/TauT family transport system substrate-binding protein
VNAAAAAEAFAEQESESVQRPLIDVQHSLSRREFLRVAASAGAVGAGAVLLGACGSDDNNGRPTSTPGIVIDPPPETTTIRLGKHTPTPAGAALYVAEQFLWEEGFTNVQYIDRPLSIDRPEQIAAGEIDIGLTVPAGLTVAVDRGDPLVVLAGVQSGAGYLFGNDKVQSLRELKGKRIWVTKRDDPTDPVYSLMAALLTYVGIDLERDVEFVELSLADIFPAILEDRVDVWLATRRSATLFQQANIGHVLIDLSMDPPWSQYFGTMATGNGDFVEKHPAATKRALRAILKGADVCAREPERAARYLVDRGFTALAYDEGLIDGIHALSYASWREFNPEDTMRFFALRLKEAGLVKSTPDELIARATDWRYLEEIKRELAV